MDDLDAKFHEFKNFMIDIGYIKYNNQKIYIKEIEFKPEKITYDTTHIELVPMDLYEYSGKAIIVSHPGAEFLGNKLETALIFNDGSNLTFTIFPYELNVYNEIRLKFNILGRFDEHDTLCRLPLKLAHKPKLSVEILEENDEVVKWHIERYAEEVEDGQ